MLRLEDVIAGSEAKNPAVGLTENEKPLRVTIGDAVRITQKRSRGTHDIHVGLVAYLSASRGDQTHWFN